MESTPWAMDFQKRMEGRGGRKYRLLLRLLPLLLRQKIRERVLELRREGLKCSEIQTKIEEEFGVLIGKSIVSMWIGKAGGGIRKFLPLSPKNIPTGH